MLQDVPEIPEFQKFQEIPRWSGVFYSVLGGSVVFCDFLPDLQYSALFRDVLHCSGVFCDVLQILY